MPADTQKPLSAGRKAGFALGDYSVNTALSALSLVFFTFLVTVAGLAPWLAGLIAWLARLVDAVTDPLMGRLSDGTRWEGGRRRPFFLIGMLPLGLFFGLMWTTPISGQMGMFLWYLFVYVGLALSMTVLSVPYMALIPELSADYDERTSLNTWRSAASVIGTMVAAAFFQLAEGLGGGADGFQTAGWLIAAAITLPWPIVWAVSFERPDGIERPSVDLRESIRALFKHGTYLRLCGIYLAGRIAMDLLGLAVPLFVTIWLGRTGDVTWTLLSMLVVVVVSLPVWLRISARSEKHHVLAAGSIWFVVCLCGVFFVEPGTPRFIMFALAGVLGVGYAVVDLMPWAMLGEVIDEDELRSGQRREGLYNGVFTFIRKVGGASSYLLGGFALSLAGYDSEAAVQPEAAVTAIRVLATFVPAACLLAALAGILGYPLTRERHQAVQRAVDERRAALSAPSKETPDAVGGVE